MDVSVAKYHHINPRFVLAGFADGGDLIRTIRLPARHGRTSVIDKTGGENHLYSIPSHPSGSDVFERRIGEGIESETAAIFQRVSDGEWPLPLADRDTLAEFIALQMVRGPERRRQMESAAGELLAKAAGQLGEDDFARWASDTAGRLLSEGEVNEWRSAVFNPEGFIIPQTARDHIEMMGETTGEIAAFFACRPWTLVRFNDHSLITCDAPVSLVAHQQDGPWVGVGVQNARLILYPVNRKTALIMRNPFDGRHPTDDLEALIERTREGAFDDESAGTKQEGKTVNECTAANAVSNLYHHPDDARFVPEKFRERDV